MSASGFRYSREKCSVEYTESTVNRDTPELDMTLAPKQVADIPANWIRRPILVRGDYNDTSRSRPLVPFELN